MTNPEFSLADEDFPKGWRLGQKQQVVSVDPQDKPPGATRSLHVEINIEVGSQLGEIGQTITVKPNTLYRVSGWMKGSRSGIAFYQIKRRKGRKELERIGTKKNGTDWQRVEVRFNSGDADNVQLLCRWAHGAKQVGTQVRFSQTELIEATGLPREGEHDPIAVATFESIGLYWKPREGSADNVCQVAYKPWVPRRGGEVMIFGSIRISTVGDRRTVKSIVAVWCTFSRAPSMTFVCD
ncbi:lipolytic protein G-D-S-L family [Rhodopirellula maiorica SM1]|uniref:Lipolytic protein G-D-S-L family n=1 Tax=Rhodopirellula maiorica SM1 TaxID=1265738 RepID=M5RHN6_9BACT|nr:lipolytic protein G-D-S-L family [Rhodopirellula maiorica SM1]